MNEAHRARLINVLEVLRFEAHYTMTGESLALVEEAIGLAIDLTVDLSDPVEYLRVIRAHLKTGGRRR